MNQITANGLTFMTTTAGEGPKVLFLTGSGADLRGPKTPLNSPLVVNFEVLTLDQRGMGQSDKPDGPNTMLDYAEDTIAILDSFDWDRVMRVGYSFGGMVAQELVLRWPERFSLNPTRLKLAFALFLFLTALRMLWSVFGVS